MATKRTRKTAVESIPAHATAKEVLALVEAGTIRDTEGAAFLQARMSAQVANGRRPRYASLKVYAQLAGEEFEFDRTNAQTRKQRRKAAEPVEAKRKAKRTTKRAAKPANVVSIDDLVAQLGSALEGASQAQVIAAFTSLSNAIAGK